MMIVKVAKMKDYNFNKIYKMAKMKTKFKIKKSIMI